MLKTKHYKMYGNFPQYIRVMPHYITA